MPNAAVAAGVALGLLSHHRFPNETPNYSYPLELIVRLPRTIAPGRPKVSGPCRVDIAYITRPGPENWATSFFLQLYFTFTVYVTS